MKWRIPAKTFLLGEYAAVAGESAIVLTTSPCFELSLANEATIQCRIYFLFVGKMHFSFAF